MKKVLEFFGLTNTEAKIYLALLNLGPSTATTIAQKASIHRRSAYDTTSRLIKKGLIGYITKNNRKYFEAVDPERLKELIKEKEQAFNEILPQLKAKYQTTIEKQETIFFKGKNGLKNIFEDQLATKQEILILGASPLAQVVLKYHFHWFNKRRETKKIPIKLLYNILHRKKRNLKYSKIKYLPKSFQNPAAMNIYGDKVAIIHWSKERPFAILIHDKEVAQGYRNYFNGLWTIAKQ
jgi:HTH-type transcriptional regulator, sugar sensing transcriptional regulator